MNIGHSHPRITEIYKSQSQKLSVLSSHYTNEFQGAFAEKLVN